MSRFLKICLLGFTLCNLGCVTRAYDKRFKPTLKLVDEAEEACSKTMDDAPRAQRECFPRLTNKELLVVVDKISNEFGLTVEATAGNDMYQIMCEPDDKTKDEIMSTPGTVKPKHIYWVSGDFARFSTYGGRLGFYTIRNCKIRKYEGE